MRALLTPSPVADRNERQRSRYGGAGARSFGGSGRPGPSWQRQRNGQAARPREPLSPPSARLSGSAMVRGFRSALPPREALILMAVINHAWLLESHLEEFAELEFLNADADRLRRAILEAGADQCAGRGGDARGARGARAFAVLSRVESAITHPSDWPARAGAAAEDVTQWWTHVVTLHRKKRTLNRELKDAERALGEEPTDANLAWLRDVQGRLSALDGSEALIEGFGLSSGRPARSV